MLKTGTVIIGAGQAGLAASHCLSALGVEHVVIERGKVAQRWRSQSWDSLRLLTPNWMTRLPGFQYQGDEPDQFMRPAALVAFFERYAMLLRAQIFTDTTVQTVDKRGGRFRVVTDRGSWSSDSVVIATGYCDLPFVPSASETLQRSITQVVPADYRRSEQLPSGGVLIVGASSTGVQLADEIQRSGRQVTLAVGRHTRVPRRYRGHDILWWFDRLGILSQRAHEVHNIKASRRQPSLQLVGKTDHSSLDLAVLHDAGVRLVGRVESIDGFRVRLADDLVATTAAADIKMADILTRIDRFIATGGVAASDPEPFQPTWSLPRYSRATLDLRDEGISSVIWATGYRRSYPWLHLPVLDERGEIRHEGGITPLPGLYVLGLNFQRRRDSSFIYGIGDDAFAIAQHIADQHAAVRVA